MIKYIFIAAVFVFSTGIFAQDSEKTQISSLIDNWHKAAAEANQKAYFNFIADDGVYIGTDETEIWTKQQFFEWSKPYFDKGKAWSFTAISRNIYLSEDGISAWFNELLDSGKTTLRGSGVLQKGDNGWKLKHYVLSLPVPNDKFKEVVDVIKKEQNEKKEVEE